MLQTEGLTAEAASQTLSEGEQDLILKQMPIFSIRKMKGWGIFEAPGSE